MSSLRFAGLQDQFATVLQSDKEQLHKIQEQNRILSTLSDKVLRKDYEIDELRKQVNKYKKYYDQYYLIKTTLSQKTKEAERLSQQNKILFEEVDKIVKDNKQTQQRLLLSEKQKHDFIQERNLTDKRLRDIEETFREYQDQCKSKQKTLMNDLEKAFRQIKELNDKVDDFQALNFENEQLKGKLMARSVANPNINYSQSHSQVKSRRRSPNQSQGFQNDASEQIERLKREIVSKDMELQRSKALNHQLSIQFDKSVSKICEFEKELSHYRKQNHELKKTLSLFVEKEQYEKMHKNRIQESEESWDEQEQEQEQESDNDRYSPFSSERPR